MHPDAHDGWRRFCEDFYLSYRHATPERAGYCWQYYCPACELMHVESDAEYHDHLHRLAFPGYAVRYAPEPERERMFRAATEAA